MTVFRRLNFVSCFETLCDAYIICQECHYVDVASTRENLLIVVQFLNIIKCNSSALRVTEIMLTTTVPKFMSHLFVVTSVSHRPQTAKEIGRFRMHVTVYRKQLLIP